MFAKTHALDFILVAAAITLSSSTAEAYNLTGYDWSHQDNPIEEPFVFRSNGWSSDFDTDELEIAFVDAMAVWSDQASAHIAYQAGGTTGSTSWTYDAENVGQYHSSTNDTAVALAQTWANGSGDVIDCDIRFYGSNGTGELNWSADPSGPGNWEIDFQIVAEHELGHCLGLDHSSTHTAIMYPSVTNGTSVSDRDLHSDDKAGAQAIYGVVLEPVLAYNDYIVDTDDGDAVIEAGEFVTLAIDIQNDGTDVAHSVVAELSTTHSVITMIDDFIQYGDIDENETADPLSGQSFEFEVSAECEQNTTVNFDLNIEDETGKTWADSFDLDISCVDEDDGGNSTGNNQGESIDDCEDGQAALTWYADVDGDGFGNSEESIEACGQPDGYAPNADDCDDRNPRSYPGADGWTPTCVPKGHAEEKAGCATVTGQGGWTGWLLAMGLLLPLRRRRS